MLKIDSNLNFVICFLHLKGSEAGGAPAAAGAGGGPRGEGPPHRSGQVIGWVY